VRLRETTGRPTTARLRLGPEAFSVREAWLADLLEGPGEGDPLSVADGVVSVGMPAFGTVTLFLRVARISAGEQAPAPVEPVQPVYARYWLHGKGPAPAGNLPVAVHFSPTRVALPELGGTATVTLTVGCGRAPAGGQVELVVPDGITVEPRQDLSYDNAADDYTAWDLTVRAAPGTAPGRYFVAARIRDEHGQVIEDTVMVAIGERRWPDAELPAEEALEVMMADFLAAAAEVELAVATPELRLVPGGRGEIRVSVTSQLASPVHGEAQLVSPFGSWEMLAPPAQGFRAAPGEPAVLRFGVAVPATARPGARWWALVKVMYFGRVRYSQAIPVSIEAPDSFDAL
jgi:alpha-mannosidase